MRRALLLTLTPCCGAVYPPPSPPDGTVWWTGPPGNWANATRWAGGVPEMASEVHICTSAVSVLTTQYTHATSLCICESTDGMDGELVVLNDLCIGPDCPVPAPMPSPPSSSLSPPPPKQSFPPISPPSPLAPSHPMPSSPAMEDALRDQQPSGLGVGATIAIAVCSSLISVVCVLAAVALGLFMLKRSRRRKGPSTNNEPADVELKQGEPSPGHPQG